MWLYGLMNVLAFLFVMRFVPETKGRSLEDIEAMLREGELAFVTARRLGSSLTTGGGDVMGCRRVPGWRRDDASASTAILDRRTASLV